MVNLSSKNQSNIKGTVYTAGYTDWQTDVKTGYNDELTHFGYNSSSCDHQHVATGPLPPACRPVPTKINNE